MEPELIRQHVMHLVDDAAEHARKHKEVRLLQAGVALQIISIALIAAVLAALT